MRRDERVFVKIKYNIGNDCSDEARIKIEKDDKVQDARFKGPEMSVIAIDEINQTADCEWFDNHNSHQRVTFGLKHLKKCHPKTVGIIGVF